MVMITPPPGGDENVPEGAPELNGTIDEYVAFMRENADPAITREEACDNLVSTLMYYISKVKREAVDGTGTDYPYAFTGEELSEEVGAGENTVLAFWGTLDVSGTHMQIDGVYQFHTFIFDLNLDVSASGTSILILNNERFEFSAGEIM